MPSRSFLAFLFIVSTALAVGAAGERRASAVELTGELGARWTEIQELREKNEKRLYDYFEAKAKAGALDHAQLDSQEQSFRSAGDGIFRMFKGASDVYVLAAYSVFSLVQKYVHETQGVPIADVKQALEPVLEAVVRGFALAKTPEERITFLLSPPLWELDKLQGEAPYLDSLLHLMEYASVKYFQNRGAEAIVLRDKDPEKTKAAVEMRRLLAKTPAIGDKPGEVSAVKVIRVIDLHALAMSPFLQEVELETLRSQLRRRVGGLGIENGLVAPLVDLTARLSAHGEKELLDVSVGLIGALNPALGRHLAAEHGIDSRAFEAFLVESGSLNRTGRRVLDRLVDRGRRIASASPEEWGISELSLRGHLKDLTLASNSPGVLRASPEAAVLRERASRFYGSLGLKQPRTFGAITVYERLGAYTRLRNYHVPGSPLLPHTTRMVAPKGSSGFSVLPWAGGVKHSDYVKALQRLFFQGILLPLVWNIEADIQRDLMSRFRDLAPRETRYYFTVLDGIKVRLLQEYDPAEKSWFPRNAIFRSVTRPTEELESFLMPLNFAEGAEILARSGLERDRAREQQLYSYRLERRKAEDAVRQEQFKRRKVEDQLRADIDARGGLDAVPDSETASRLRADQLYEDQQRSREDAERRDQMASRAKEDDRDAQQRSEFEQRENQIAQGNLPIPTDRVQEQFNFDSFELRQTDKDQYQQQQIDREKRAAQNADQEKKTQQNQTELAREYREQFNLNAAKEARETAKEVREAAKETREADAKEARDAAAKEAREAAKEVREAALTEAREVAEEVRKAREDAEEARKAEEKAYKDAEKAKTKAKDDEDDKERKDRKGKGKNILGKPIPPDEEEYRQHFVPPAEEIARLLEIVFWSNATPLPPEEQEERANRNFWKPDVWVSLIWDVDPMNPEYRVKPSRHGGSPKGVGWTDPMPPDPSTRVGPETR